jgi:hypothetical protein
MVQVPQAQTQTQDNRLQASMESFPTYSSPFDSYPLLRSRLQRISPVQSPTVQYQQEVKASSSIHSLASSISSFIVSSHHFVPDLKPLKRAASFKALDHSKQICQYELPGGGVCRDEGCRDVHLSRGPDGTSVDEVEPSGTSSFVWLIICVGVGLAYANFTLSFFPCFLCWVRRGSPFFFFRCYALTDITFDLIFFYYLFYLFHRCRYSRVPIRYPPSRQ